LKSIPIIIEIIIDATIRCEKLKRSPLKYIEKQIMADRKKISLTTILENQTSLENMEK